MSLTCGLVGLPNVGKSTLFNQLTNSSVPAANYPFCTIDPNYATVLVPNEQLNLLHKMEKSDRVIPSVVQITDIAGLITGAAYNKGLGNNFLHHISQVDLLIHVIRCFADTSISHIQGNLNPVRDFELVRDELILADMAKLENLLKTKKITTNTQQVCKQILNRISMGQELFKPRKHDDMAVKNLHLFTEKPMLVVANGIDDIDDLTQYCFINNLQLLTIASPQQEQALSSLIQQAHKQLGWLNFFTCGPKETRSWSVTRGSTAQIASGRIHSDFMNKFIRAQILSYQNWLTHGSIAKARAAQAIITVGKNYIVEEGDIISFLIK